ncbi:hypothetical protein [Streptomyces sp. NPDC006879]|uniref:hypothetical protein n=1 Tax=Streptomyces sp. NPDC006879 TaxID=3364767 RepID=UPI00369B2A88
MSARRPLLTATAAGTLLCAAWLMPSANATAEHPTAATPSATLQAIPARTADSRSTSPSASGPTTDSASISGSSTGAGDGPSLHLAATGSMETVPYLIGGTAFLSLGAGFVAFSVRRGRAR